MQRVDLVRTECNRTLLLDRDVARLNPYRGGGREARRARHLPRSVAGRQRDDHAVLVHARDVGTERLPGCSNRRRRRAVVLERSRHDARVFGRQQIHRRRLDAQHRGRARARRLTGERIHSSRRLSRSGWRLGLRVRLSTTGGCADHLYRGLTLARTYARFDNGDAAGHAGDGAVVVDPRDRNVVRGPDESDRRDDVAGAGERSGKEAAALSHFDRHGAWGHLNFGHVLGAEAPGKHERDPDHKRASPHNGANVNARKCRCQANLSPWYHTRTRRVVCLSSPLSPRCDITAFTRTTPPGVGIGTTCDEPATPWTAATGGSPTRRNASSLRALERPLHAGGRGGTRSS